MGYNHAQAKKRFLAEWRIKFRYYRQNGLTLEQILPLYKMYNAELRSDRSYYEQTVPLTDAEHGLRVAEEPVLATYNEFNWMFCRMNWHGSFPACRKKGCGHFTCIAFRDIHRKK